MAKKKWGQNFLIHQSVVATILCAADVQAQESVLEIGPGHGMLTRALLKQGNSVTAIEIDPDLCVNLREQFQKAEGFTLIERDVMECTPQSLAKLAPSPAKMVANLPYNIATPLLLRMLPVRKAWKSLTLMLQLEVAQRICATPAGGASGESGKLYGPLSLVGALGFECRLVAQIPPEAFRPKPQIESAVIQLKPRNSGLSFEEEDQFLRWSRRLFQQRRKTLLNGIRQQFPEWYQQHEKQLRNQLGSRRPETLNFEEWRNLFHDYLQNENF